MPSSNDNRWSVLAVLFFARLAMAFQFQAVAALSPIYVTSFGVGLAEIGFLIGLYLSPGLVIALPGAAIGRRFGDREIIALGMVLMVLGACVMLFLSTWEAQIAGRLLSGIGGVLLNVLMSKIVTDQFTGREIATAMAIFVNSWPVGIAAALLVLPLIGTTESPQGAQVVVTLATIAGLALFVLGTRSIRSSAEDAPKPVPLTGMPLAATVIAGSIWGLYNGALAMVFGFGPTMLVEDGWSLPEASAMTSLVLWLGALTLPLGGILADKLQRRDTIMLLGFLLFAAALCLAPHVSAVLVLFVFMGLVCGLPAGPIMSLPSIVLQPGNRAYGMGVYFTLFYVGVVFAPALGGWISEATETASSAFYLGAAMLVTCCGALVVFRRLVRPTPGSS